MPIYEQTVTLSGMQTFEALVGDANANDTLQIRWVANYPPKNPATAVISSADGSDKSGDRGKTGTWLFKISVGCDRFMQGADHNLVAIVSDRGFISPDAADAPVYVSKSSLLYNWDDQRGPDGQPMSQIVATMTGWRIAGCTP